MTLLIQIIGRHGKTDILLFERGWSGGAKVLGKLPVPGRPTILITVGQGPTALAVGAGGGCLDIFTLIYPFSSLSPSLWETARYRLKYCLKGPLNPKQPTNQPLFEKLYHQNKHNATTVIHKIYTYTTGREKRKTKTLRKKGGSV